MRIRQNVLILSLYKNFLINNINNIKVYLIFFFKSKLIHMNFTVRMK